MNRFRMWVAVAVLGAVCVGGFAPKAYAQDDPRDKKITLQLNDADVRDALRMMFKGLGVSYQISQEVQGTITVDFKDIPFETALKGILDQVNATYRVETGIYQVIPREKFTGPENPETTGPAPTAKKVVRRIRVLHADPYYILYMLTGQGAQYPEISTVNLSGNGGYGNNNGNNGNNGYGNGNGNGGFGGNNFGGGNNNFGGGGGFGGGFGGRGGGFGGGGGNLGGGFGR